MIHKDIQIYPDLIEFPVELTSALRYKSRPLCSFLQRTVLKGLKFATTYRGLCVIGTASPSPGVLVNSSKAVAVEVSFDPAAYRELASVEARQEFFIDMLENGLTTCALHHPVAMDELRCGIERFRAGSYSNEWVHRAKRIRARGLSAELQCSMTEFRFRLSLNVSRGEAELLDRVILETPPDELHFDHRFKDLIDPLVRVSLSELS